MSKLHKRNIHQAPYDLEALCLSHPDLEAFIVEGPKRLTINFADPLAVKALNIALLKHHYNIQFWDIPEGYLCPAIPGRADYIHHLADLLSGGEETKIPKGAAIKVLDIGTGANCIYPILGHQIYGWSFVGLEADPKAVKTAQSIVKFNTTLTKGIEIRHQQNPKRVFETVIQQTEHFTACICNPPFHATQEAAQAGTRRKLKNLGDKTPKHIKLNFGGQSNELIFPGGEVAFIQQIIKESVERQDLCQWFTSLVAKEKHLPILLKSLKQVGASNRQVIDMAQGQKKSRILVWSWE